MTGSSDFPLSVNEYSIRTGYSEYTVRATIASFSNNLSRSESNRPLTGRFVSISEKRFGPFISSNKMRPTQRLLMISIAFSKRGHKLLSRSEEHTSELQSRFEVVCRLLLEKKKNKQ